MKRTATKTRNAWRTAGLLLAVTGLAFLLLGVTGCHHKPKDEEKSKVVEVTTKNPEFHKEMTRIIYQPGYLRPYEMTPIYTKIAGFAKEPIYDIGDFVKKDDMLVEIYVPEVVQELRVKAARIKQAEADLKQAKEEALAAEAGVEAADRDVDAKFAAIKSADAQVKRWEAEEKRGKYLLDKGVFDKATHDEIIKELASSEATWEESKAKHLSAKAHSKRASAHFHKAEADIEVADANVLVAKADYDQKSDWLAYRFITAPFDGVITDRKVHSGHFLQPSNSGSTSKAAEPLFVMMRVDIMRCTVDVPELDALLVRRGDKAMIRFQAKAGEIEGTIERTTRALDERTRTLRVEIHLRNPGGAEVLYTASASGEITSVQKTPPSGGAGTGYKKNATVLLQIGGRKGKGGGAVVSATTDSSGSVINYALHSGGRGYVPGTDLVGQAVSELALRPNMYANVTILSRVRNAWALPPAAVMNDILANNNRRYCFLAEDGKARQYFLETGPQCDGGLQVLRKQRAGRNTWEEITGKEAVVTTNNKSLQEGQEVQVQTQ